MDSAKLEKLLKRQAIYGDITQVNIYIAIYGDITQVNDDDNNDNE